MKKELRIGNYYYHPIALSFERMDDVDFISSFIEKFEPIPLTEEWLLKIDDSPTKKEWKGNGADYQPETSKTIEKIYYAFEDVKIISTDWYYKKNKEDNWIIERSYSVDFCGERISLHDDKVHILQNLCHALTGNELTITK